MADSPRFAFARTTVFRLTLLQLVLMLAGTALLAGVAWWATVGFGARQAQQEVERGMGVLAQAAAISGARGVALSIEARMAADRAGNEYYLLVAPNGERVAGNLSTTASWSGWRQLQVRRSDGTEVTVLALATALPGGGQLVVGRDLSGVRALETQLLGAAGWVGAGALVLGVLGGLLIGRGVARRAKGMETALAAVQAGNLGRRLPLGTGGDEFDRLSSRINATLDRMQELMGALRRATDDIAHDLRTPLSRLRQSLETAANTPDAARRDQAIAAAGREADGLLDILSALLRIAQVESATQRAGFAPLDLSEVLGAVAEVYASAAEERGQTLAADIVPGITSFGDRALLTQLFANLVENAVRHGREGGRIAITLRARPDGGAEAIVADDGPGIPEAERDAVFRRFHRLDAARATPGSGLGLALVRAVAGLHDMTIMLEDAGPGLRVRLVVPPRMHHPA